MTDLLVRDVPDDVIHSAMEYMHRSTGKDGSVAYSGGFGGGSRLQARLLQGGVRVFCQRVAAVHTGT